jgi:hypothetical protein
MGRRRTSIAAVLALLVASGVARAQFGGRLAEGPGVPPRFPPADFRDGTFTACKLMFESATWEAGGVGWSTDYPFAAINMMTRLSELTKTRVSRDTRGEIEFWVVRASDDALFECPMVMGSDVGTAEFSETEVQKLRAYLLKGGFLWVDDFWGTNAWLRWSEQIHRVLPEFPITEVSPDDPIRNAFVVVPEVPQVSSIQFWRRNGHTSERDSDSPGADIHKIVDAHGRAMVIMTHNTDIGDSMEREAEDPDFFAQFSPKGYGLAVDIVLYAATH